MSPHVEKIKLETEEDQGVLKKWGDRIYRISFVFTDPKVKEQASFTVSVK